jgi:hypothetical protein
VDGQDQPITTLPETDTDGQQPEANVDGQDQPITTLPETDTDGQQPIESLPPQEDPAPELNGDSQEQPITTPPETDADGQQPDANADGQEQPIATPPQEDLNLEPTEIKQDCSAFESSLESFYVGLASEEIQGTQQIFVFLNYDILEKTIKTPDNDSSEAIFCRNEGTKLYPIVDANPDTTIKWATVDELICEKKIVEEPVDPMIASFFAKNENLWNIEDSEKIYIDFPFVVYGVRLDSSDKFQTVTTSEEDEDPFVADGKIEKYGTPDSPEEDGIADEYNPRYCFTLNPIAGTEEPTGSRPRRYAMFAWKTRYIVKESEIEQLDSQFGGEPVPAPVSGSEQGQEPAPEPEQVPSSEPVPATDPEQVPSSEMVPTTEPLSEPATATEPAPLAEPGSAPVVEPGSEPAPLAEPGSEPAPLAEPGSAPLAEPGSEPETSPEPGSETAPAPEPEPEPAPETVPLAEPETAPSPEEEQEPVLSEEDQEKIAILKLNFATIYTITKSKFTDNKPLVTWGILNSEQFTGL